MSTFQRWQISAAALIAATLMAGCGGGGGGGNGAVINPTPIPTPITPVEPGSPTPTLNVETAWNGFWISGGARRGNDWRKAWRKGVEPSRWGRLSSSRYGKGTCSRSS